MKSFWRCSKIIYFWDNWTRLDMLWAGSSWPSVSRHTSILNILSNSFDVFGGNDTLPNKTQALLAHGTTSVVLGPATYACKPLLKLKDMYMTPYASHLPSQAVLYTHEVTIRWDLLWSVTFFSLLYTEFSLTDDDLYPRCWGVSFKDVL